MIKIEVDASGPHAAVDAMIKKLSHFKRVDIGLEMSAWQTADMHRGRPFTMRSRAKGRATTVVRPHSLYEVQRRARALKRYERLVRRYLRKLGKPGGRRIRTVPARITPQRTSTRPYLRDELLRQLKGRMQRMLREKLTWR